MDPGLSLIQEPPVPRHSEATLAAIKNAVDIVALVGEYLPLHRAGSKFKALCPFHDDHNPSLELNPERQSFKCWSCGAGGDVFDFVKNYERVDFPEALRMLADRAGIVLESPSAAVPAPARGRRRPTCSRSTPGPSRPSSRPWRGRERPRAYVERRGLGRASVERFRLGYAPAERGWLLSAGASSGFSAELLEQAGLVVRDRKTSPGLGPRAVPGPADLPDP